MNRARKLAESFVSKLDDASRRDAREMIKAGRNLDSVAHFLMDAQRAKRLLIRASQRVEAGTEEVEKFG